MRSTSETRKILAYLRAAASGPRGRTVTGPGLCGDRGSARASSGGVMACAALLEDAGDDLLQGRVVHAQVEHPVPVEDCTQDFGHARAVDFQVGHRPFAAGDFA